MAYRNSELHRGGSYGSTLRSEPNPYLADPGQAGGAGTFTGGLLVSGLVILGLLVGVGTLSVGGVGEIPAAQGSGAHGSVSGHGGGTEAAAPLVAPAN